MRFDICANTFADIKAASAGGRVILATDWDNFTDFADDFGNAEISAEYRDPKQRFFKFYKISMTAGDEYNCLVRWGRIGTKGSSQIVTHREAEKRWKSKIKKGYETPTNPFENTPLKDAIWISKEGDSYRVFKEDPASHQTTTIGGKTVHIWPICDLPFESVLALLTHRQ